MFEMVAGPLLAVRHTALELGYNVTWIEPLVFANWLSTL
jgi:hypothetical protein